jgi:hypothetical protein
MAWTLVSPNGTGSAGNAATTTNGDQILSKPSGVVDGNLLVAVWYLETDVNTVDSVPAGWNLAGSIANTGAFTIRVYWKIAASEPSAWTWSAGTNATWSAAVVAAFTGGSGSGSFIDVVGTGGQADGVVNTSQTAPSVTTTVNNSLVIFAYANFSGTNTTVIGGFATSLAVSFGSVTIGSATKTTAGATGTTNPTTGPGTDTYAAMHVAFLLTGAGGAAAQVARNTYCQAIVTQ